MEGGGRRNKDCGAGGGMEEEEATNQNNANSMNLCEINKKRTQNSDRCVVGGCLCVCLCDWMCLWSTECVLSVRFWIGQLNYIRTRSSFIHCDSLASGFVHDVCMHTYKYMNMYMIHFDCAYTYVYTHRYLDCILCMNVCTGTQPNYVIGYIYIYMYIYSLLHLECHSIIFSNLNRIERLKEKMGLF